MFARIGKGTTIGAAVRLAVAVVLVSTSAAAQPGLPSWIAPAEPAVRPWLPSRFEYDLDNNRVDDRLDRSVGKLRGDLARERDPSKRAEIAAELAAPRAVEAIFTEQVSQRQIDAFLALGGEIRHVFRSVSYGWTGSIPGSAIDALPAALGGTLLVVAEDTAARLHMDEATRTGRVRTVWASGFAGGGGYSGTSDITVGIVDSGVDDSHPDLAGRMAYWKDHSSDNEASPRDVIQHGSHVAGIAVGSGGVFGTGPGTLKYTDSGNLDGVQANSFFLSGVHYPAQNMTIDLSSAWLGGGSTLLRLAARTNGVSGGFIPICTSNNGTASTSPISMSCQTLGNVTQIYSSALAQTQNGSIEHYATTVSVGPILSVGDGFHAFRGVAPGAKWAGAKAFTNAGTGSGAWIGAAIDDLVSKRADIGLKVMNLSLGIIGNPGTDAGLRSKVNTAVNGGVVVVASAGNDGPGTGATSYVDDPGRASLVITVGATNDANSLTRYTSSGFPSPGSDEDFKPDLLAPGGSDFYSQIMSVDSNDSDADSASFSDRQANDYTNIKGTSMSTPFVAGAAALMIDAIQETGQSWSFGSSAQPLFVKMMLCASSTETNANREANAGINPTLGRASAPKDLFEGYGLMNPDAAIEALTLVYSGGSLGGTTAGGAFDRRAWGRRIGITSGGGVQLTLTVPLTADYDMYLYSGTPDAKGNPVIRASSTNAGLGAAEQITFTPTTSETRYLFIKRVSGSGDWSLASGASQGVCGDGQKTGNEQCDDGNVLGGDCCSATCTYEASNSPCNDGLFCTSTDRCNSTGVCSGSGNPCSTGGECNNTCSEANDNCATPSGTACLSDSNPCTVDQCNGSGSCTHAAGHGGSVCRAAAGVCDVQETCAGTSTSCPADSYATGGTCRASAGVCDQAETCNGAGPGCPANTFVSAATTCRAASGVCDAAESCTGSSASCPANDFADSGTVCRVASGVCDAAETCTGSSGSCPEDDLAATTKVCRPASGGCDEAETCTGTSSSCPPNEFLPRDTVCRGAVSVCDAAETCQGGTASCPADVFANADAVCRPASGVCDVEERCTGESGACPSNGFAAGDTLCRPAGGVCDTAETCTGTSASCPGDQVASGVPCRAASGACDVAETCDGTAKSCPADGVASAAVVCRASTDSCDVAETCTGSSKTCPANELEPDGSPCSDGIACTAESCQGGVCTQQSESCGECGDGHTDFGEACDDGNNRNNDCCSNSCSINDGGNCDDGLFCNGADDCSGGACSIHEGDPCAGADGDADCSESCDEAADACGESDADGTPCTDGLFCTGNDFCSGGECSQHAGSPCAGADGDGDCTETCDEAADACTQADPDGSVCDDSDDCTENDECSAGTCTGDPSPDCTSTTTLPPASMCGDATEDGQITASDSQVSLLTAVGTNDCLPEICDYNGDDRITATDSLLILRVAVGQDVPPNCPAPSSTASATPSTIPGSTTSTTLDE